MHKKIRAMAFALCILMFFSTLISPFSSVYASTPSLTTQTPAQSGYETPSFTQPRINTPIFIQPETNPPALEKSGRKLPDIITKPKDDPSILTRPTRRETPARAVGVSYKLKDGVEKLPSDMNYNLEQIRLEELAVFDKNTSSSGETIDPDKVRGIRYKPGSKFMVVPKASVPTFTPKANKIYLDENEGTAYRILEASDTDANGNQKYVVETPVLTDIFESYKIPAQDIKLTTGNIAYLAPGAEISPESGMHKNYVAAADDKGYISGYKYEGNKHIITLTANKILFRYPSKEEEKKTKEEKEKAEKEKFKGDWWANEQHSDLRGFEDEDELKVEIAIKEGVITVEDPTFHADFDLNMLTTQVKADFYFESKTQADITFVGDLKINKKMEACIFGYDIDLGSVLGKEKGNRAFVGIFLVLGVDGKVHVEVRTTTTGDARAGFAYKALGFGFIPYKVGPYVTYKPTGFDAAFTADGELHATLACVPQVGVIIWGTEIAALQIWLGFKADAKIEANAEVGTIVDASTGSKGSLNLSAFAEMVGYLFGCRYSIFYLDFPIYHGEWDIGSEISGGGGDLIRKVTPSFFIKADASTNIIEGRIVFDKDAIPYANRDFTVEVWKDEKLKVSIPARTDNDGNFSIVSDSFSYNLIPTDRVVINVADETVYEVSNKKYKVTGKSKKINPTVPYTDLEFNVDTFNDLVSGTVSGKYTGPVDIIVYNSDSSVTNYTANAVNGIFSISIPINEKTMSVKSTINFEGSIYPYIPLSQKPNLDALEINFYNEFVTEDQEDSNTIDNDTPDVRNTTRSNRPIKGRRADTNNNNRELNVDEEGNKIVRPRRVYGVIINKGEMGPIEVHGENYIRDSILDDTSSAPSYSGTVKITSIPIKSSMLDILNKKDHSNLTDPLIDSSGWTATVQTQPAGLDGELTSASTFEFIDPEVLAYDIEIEYEGLKLKKRYNPFVFHYTNTLQTIEEFARRPVQNEVTLVTEEKIDSIINPADNLKLWNAAWTTQIGRMELTQTGNRISGKLIQGNTSYTIEGIVTNGVFKGSYIIPSESMFGEIVSFEMEIAPDGQSINFRNIESGARLKGLNGTKALRQR
jgi:hypothetical protein